MGRVIFKGGDAAKSVHLIAFTREQVGENFPDVLVVFQNGDFSFHRIYIYGKLCKAVADLLKS
mgnify:CR=1 FL=1